MPQKKSYFALQLPKRWWVFGLDLALHGDIDVYQFNFFSELVKQKVWVLSVFWSDLICSLKRLLRWMTWLYHLECSCMRAASLISNLLEITLDAYSSKFGYEIHCD